MSPRQRCSNALASVNEPPPPHEVADDPPLAVQIPHRQHKNPGLSFGQQHLTRGEGWHYRALQPCSCRIATSSQYSSCLFVFTAGLNVEVFIRHAVNAKSLSTIFRVSGCGDANLTPACHRCQGPRPRAALPAPRPPGLAHPLHPTVFVFFLWVIFTFSSLYYFPDLRLRHKEIPY